MNEASDGPLHEQLRRLRLSSGRTLEQLAKETRIPLRYLEAIEQGQLHFLPEGIYRRNFVRAYLKALILLSPSEIPGLVERLTSSVERHDREAGLAGRKPLAGPAPRWVAPVLFLAALCLLALAGWFGWRFWKGASTPAPSTFPSVSPTPERTSP